MRVVAAFRKKKPSPDTLECPECDAEMVDVACTVDGCPAPHHLCPNGCPT